MPTAADLELMEWVLGLMGFDGRNKRDLSLIAPFYPEAVAALELIDSDLRTKAGASFLRDAIAANLSPLGGTVGFRRVDPSRFPHLRRERVLRLNGNPTRLSGESDDPWNKAMYDIRAELLNLSHDVLYSKLFDCFLETLLSHSDPAYKRFQETGGIGQAYRNPSKVLQVLVHKNELSGKRYVRVYRFPIDHVEKREADFLRYRYKGSRLQIRLYLPGRVQELFFGKGSPAFKSNSRPYFLKHLYLLFLRANGIPEEVPSTSKGIRTVLNQIAEIEEWKPFGWRSPPTLHTITDLYDNMKYESHRSDTDKAGSVVFLFKEPEHDPRADESSIQSRANAGLDPVKEYLPYILNRLWRDHNAFFSMLVIETLRSHELYFPPLGIPSDFESRLAALVRNPSLVPK